MTTAEIIARILLLKEDSQNMRWEDLDQAEQTARIRNAAVLLQKVVWTDGKAT